MLRSGGAANPHHRPARLTRHRVDCRALLHRAAPCLGLVVTLVSALAPTPAAAQACGEVRLRSDRLCQIRKKKFDHILPEAVRENGIDMWIIAQKKGHNDPLWELLGRGYTGTIGYYIFTDRGGDQIERAALGISPESSARSSFISSSSEPTQCARRSSR